MINYKMNYILNTDFCMIFITEENSWNKDSFTIYVIFELLREFLTVFFACLLILMILAYGNITLTPFFDTRRVNIPSPANVRLSLNTIYVSHFIFALFWQ